MEMEEFVWEPSSLPFFFTRPFFVSLTVGLVCTWILTPLLGEFIIPKSRNFKEKDKSLFKTLAASTLHAFVTTTLSTYILIQGLLGSNRFFAKTPLGFTSMQIMLGYFVGDFIVVLLDPHLRKDYGSIAHHIAGIIGISLGLYLQGKGMFFIVYRMIAEASTPFVNGFHLFQMTDNRQGRCYMLTVIGMMGTFFAFRILVIPWHWYELLLAVFHPEVHKVIPVFFRFWLGFNYSVFDVLNAYWFYKMILGAIKLYQSRTKKA